MPFYDLSKTECDQMVATIHDDIDHEIAYGKNNSHLKYFSDSRLSIFYTFEDWHNISPTLINSLKLPHGL